MASHGTTITCVVHNVGHAGIAGDNATNFCECINECDVTDFDTVLSSGRMSPKVILENIGNSSDIPARFINATETRNRVDTSLMMHSVRLLTGVAEAHRRMRFHVNMDFVDAGTSWTRAVSRLLGNLNEMVQGHVDDSFGLLGTLDYVYSRHVDYLATSLSSLLQECDVLTAGVRMIAISAQSRSTRSEEDHLAGLLHDKLRYLKNMLNDFDNLLKKEPQKSTYSMEYFPNPLNAKNCAIVFRKCKDILPEKIESLETIIDKIVPGTILKPTEAVSFTDVTDFRQILSYLSWCLLSYKDEVLDGFRDNFVVMVPPVVQGRGARRLQRQPRVLSVVVPAVVQGRGARRLQKQPRCFPVVDAVDRFRLRNSVVVAAQVQRGRRLAGVDIEPVHHQFSVEAHAGHCVAR